MHERGELGSTQVGHDLVGDRRVEPVGRGLEGRERRAAVGKPDRLVAEALQASEVTATSGSSSSTTSTRSPLPRGDRILALIRDLDGGSIRGR
jgi:hypothetical protein